jgi:hypothetical protein
MNFDARTCAATCCTSIGDAPDMSSLACYVADLADAFCQIAQSPYLGDGVSQISSLTIAIGNGRNFY